MNGPVVLFYALSAGVGALDDPADAVVQVTGTR